MRWVLTAVALLLASSSAHADDKFHVPTPGNQYVSVTKTKLFVVWSLPKNLAPIDKLLDKERELEAFMARTVIGMCNAQRRAKAVETLPCKVQIVRLKSNDEYSKSASGGFSTVAKMELPVGKFTDEAFKESLSKTRQELVKWFTRFQISHDRLKR